MSLHPLHNHRPIPRPFGAIYAATVALLVLTGFGQMPIFKRYYVADLPGLGWLAQYYVTHWLHYAGAIVLLALAAYAAVITLGRRPGWRRVTLSGYLRGALLAGIVLTGALRVVKNFSGVTMSAGAIVFLDLAHLILVMALLAAMLGCTLAKKRWTKPFAATYTDGRSS